MSLISGLGATALNAQDLAKALAPQIQTILASESSDEDKALKLIETLSDAWLVGVRQDIQALTAAASKLFDGYTVTLTISKKEQS